MFNPTKKIGEAIYVVGEVVAAPAKDIVAHWKTTIQVLSVIAIFISLAKIVWDKALPPVFKKDILAAWKVAQADGFLNFMKIALGVGAGAIWLAWGAGLVKAKHEQLDRVYPNSRPLDPQESELTQERVFRGKVKDLESQLQSLRDNPKIDKSNIQNITDELSELDWNSNRMNQEEFNENIESVQKAIDKTRCMISLIVL